MRSLTLVACILITAVSALRGQSCEPTVSRVDKISKEQVDVWAQDLYSTSFLGGLTSTSEVSITATIGRYGSVNAINLQLQKKEESATNAAFETAYQGAQGKPFYLGVKDGQPVALQVTDVRNGTNLSQELFGPKGVTTVILSAVLENGELAKLRETLTTRTVDAVRIMLAGNQIVDKSVSDGNGKRLMAKFVCFYQSLDQRGIDLATSGSTEPSASMPAIVIDEKSSPGDVLKEIYIAANEGRYSEIEKLLSTPALDAYKSPIGSAQGGVKGVWDRQTRNGTLTGVMIVSERVRGEGADVTIHLAFRSGQSIDVVRPLVKEASGWRVSTWTGR